MEKRTIRVAAVQISPVFDQPGGTLDKVLQVIAEAASRGVKFAVFPETFIPYYPYFSYIESPAAIGPAHLKLYDEAVVIPGPVTEALAAAAKRHAMVLVIGVTERDDGTLYNAQLVFDADGTIVLKRRKITPTYHERMIWGQGDGAGLMVVNTAVGRVGALACWEHFNPLARYTLMAQGEEIHAAQFPGSLVGDVFADQMEVSIRNHALEAGCFVVNATGWLTDAQVAAMTDDEGMRRGLRGGNRTAIITPEGRHLVSPMTHGEGLLVADCDVTLITKRKRMMDSVGHYARPELFQLHVDTRPANKYTRHDGIRSEMPNAPPLPTIAVPATSIAGSDADDRAPDATADQRVAVLRSATS